MQRGGKESKIYRTEILQMSIFRDGKIKNLNTADENIQRRGKQS